MKIGFCQRLIFEILIVHKPFMGSCEVPHKIKYIDDRHVVNLNPSLLNKIAVKGINVNRTGHASAEIITIAHACCSLSGAEKDWRISESLRQPIVVEVVSDILQSFSAPLHEQQA